MTEMDTWEETKPSEKYNDNIYGQEHVNG